MHFRAKRLLCGGAFFVSILLAPADQLELLPTADVRLRGYYSAPQYNGDTRQSDAWLADARINAGLRGNLSEFTELCLQLHIDASSSMPAAPDDIIADLGPSQLTLVHPYLLPISLSGGRILHHWGNGLLFSGRDGDWLLDSATFEAEMQSWTLEVLAIFDTAAIAPPSAIKHATALRLQKAFDSTVCQEIEVSGIYSDQQLTGGLRGKLRGPGRSWCYIEGLLQDQEQPANDAWLTDLYLVWPESSGLKPARKLRWTWASGTDSSSFEPIYSHEDWGQALSPRLSNLHTVSLSTAWKISNWTINSELFTYFQDTPQATYISDERFNNGGYSVSANGKDRYLGTELDITLSCELNSWSTIECFAGLFINGSALRKTPEKQLTELRLQWNAYY